MAMTAEQAQTSGNMYAAATVISAYGQSEAQKAAAINQQTAYLVSARDTLAIANVRADMSEQYAAIQAGRTLKKSEMDAMNYQITGNSLLKNMRSVNATMRARAAASGVAVGAGGSFDAVAVENVKGTMRDVGISDLNALTARVLGFEDATAMVQSTEYQNILNTFSAARQAGQYETAATAARSQGGLLASATLTEGAIRGGLVYSKANS